jgi:hypothetical protein
LNGDLKKWGFLDPVGAAWDLVPLSFVYDWFFNLGDALKALEAYAVFDERIGWNTQITEVTAQHYLNVRNAGGMSNSNLGYYFHSFTDPNWSFLERVELKSRVPVVSFLPVMAGRLRLNVLKVVDLLALLQQIVLGRSGRR